MVRNGRLYAFGGLGLGDGAIHDEYLVRWPLASAAAGDLRAPEWWAGKARGFVPHAPHNLGPGPDGHGEYHDAACRLADGVDVLIHDAQYRASELPDRASWGHAAADYCAALGVRKAPGLTGPWSAVSLIWRPP